MGAPNFEMNHADSLGRRTAGLLEAFDCAKTVSSGHEVEMLRWFENSGRTGEASTGHRRRLVVAPTVESFDNEEIKARLGRQWARSTARVSACEVEIPDNDECSRKAWLMTIEVAS